jgi:hypothetical protein
MQFCLSTKRYVLIFGVLWLVFGGADWWMRFSYYGWGDKFRLPTGAETSTRQDRGENALPTPETLYIQDDEGGLTSLLRVAALKEKYAEERVPYTLIRDAKGYYNPVDYLSAEYPVVILGDSFITSGRGTNSLISSVLEDRLKQTVYNAGMPGRGPLYPLTTFWPTLLERPPKVLIWGFIERDIDGELFSRIYGRLGTAKHGDGRQAQGKLHGRGFMLYARGLMAALKNELPDSSAAAQFGRIAETYIDYYLFNEVNSDVVIAQGATDAESMLFLAESIEQSKRTPEDRGLTNVVSAIRYVNQRCRENGIELVILLIPDKFSVYGCFLENVPAPPSAILSELEKMLVAENVHVINLLPVFQQHALAGEQLYWRDDTHWNDSGVRVAVDEVAKFIQE